MILAEPKYRLDSFALVNSSFPYPEVLGDMNQAEVAHNPALQLFFYFRGKFFLKGTRASSNLEF